jgi:DNA primase
MQRSNVAILREVALLEHLKSRHLDVNIHKTFIEDKTATFPIYNLLGQLKGFQQYRPDKPKKIANHPREAKYFTRGTGFWGLESWSFSNSIFLVEGVFDAARLTSRRLSALAVLSSDLSELQKTQLKLIKIQRPIIALCDGDAAGLKLAKYAHYSYIMKEDVSAASEKELCKVTRGHL